MFTKITFFDTNSLQSHKNVSIKKNKLKKVDTLSSKKYNFLGYGSVIHKNDKYKLIFSSWDIDKSYGHKSKLYLTEDKTGLTFDINNNVEILKNHGQLCIHQSIRHDKNLNEYLLVGGVRVLISSKMAGHDKKCKNNMQTTKLGEYTILNNNYKQEYCRSNGLYIMSSSNLLKWKDMFDKPLQISLRKDLDKSNIIDRKLLIQKSKSKSLIKKLKDLPRWTSLDLYDTQPSFLYDERKQKYVLYTRDNIKTGVRYVEYHESKDLITWDGPHPIKLITPFNFNKDNIYYFKVTYHSKYNYYSAFAKYYSPGKLNGIFLFLSNDGITWKRVSKILDDDDKAHYYTSIFEGSPVQYKRKLLFYTSYKQKVINIYSLRPDGYSYIYSQKGSFITNKIKLNNNNIRINSLSHKGGYVKIELLDTDMKLIPGYSIDMFDIINGNHLEKIVSWNNVQEITYTNFLHIKVMFVNSNIYSLIY